MAGVLQTKYPTSPITNNIPRNQRPSLLRVRHVTCSVSNTNNSHPNHDKLVVEKRLVNQPLSNDPALQSTWSHRFWVAAGCTTVSASFVKSIIGGFNSHLWLQPAFAGYAGYLFADLGAGVYHWALDNYGDESTPIVGDLIEAFLGHHKWPWRIIRQQFANKLQALARGTTLIVLPLVLAFNDPVFHGFVSTFSFCIMFSQIFHAWAHKTKSKLPPLVVTLQDMGLILSRREHAEHHRAPHNNNYCIMSGVWNKVLNESNFFGALEKLLYLQFGVRPRSWSDLNSELIEEINISNNIDQAQSIFANCKVGLRKN